jgi:hypothetical protein
MNFDSLFFDAWVFGCIICALMWLGHRAAKKTAIAREEALPLAYESETPEHKEAVKLANILIENPNAVIITADGRALLSTYRMLPCTCTPKCHGGHREVNQERIIRGYDCD